eukprot:COSAG02_NODE_40535_length_404_cov_0.937705_1_plen_59_part_00
MHSLRDAEDLSAREDIHLVRHSHVYISVQMHAVGLDDTYEMLPQASEHFHRAMLRHAV